MGLREAANQKKGLTTTIAIGLVVLSVGFLAWQMTGSSQAASDAPMGFYSDDDGKTFFQDDASKLPPFDHNGKQAVRAFIYTCDDGKTLFVGYLERYTPDALAKLNAAKADSAAFEAALSQVTATGSELKKPGDAKWAPRSSAEGRAAAKPACPGGSGTIQLVF